MKDYQLQFDSFAFPKSRELTRKYLESYWLDSKEYMSYWKPLQSTIFLKDHFEPNEIAFQRSFDVYRVPAGVLYDQNDYEELQKCLIKIADSTLVIIEDYDVEDSPHLSGPPLRMKYDVNARYEDIYPQPMEEGVSYELFGRPIRNYFVFSNSGLWAMYGAYDWIQPTNVWALSPKVSSIFLEHISSISG